MPSTNPKTTIPSAMRMMTPCSILLTLRRTLINQLFSRSTPIKNSNPPVNDIGISSSTALPKIRVNPNHSEVRTPVHGVSAPSFCDVDDNTGKCIPGRLPPAPEMIPAAPATRNSLSRLISSPEATSIMFEFNSKHSTMSNTTTMTAGICSPTTFQSTRLKSSRPNTGHMPPVTPLPDQRRLADLAVSIEMPKT